MWALSWAGQIAWDLLGLMAIHAGLKIGPLIQQTLLGALRQLVLDREISPNLNDLVPPMARYALLLGIFSVWWNPRLKEKMKRKGARMVGIGDYYVQQLIFLAVRGAVLYWITSQTNIEQEQALHLFMLFFSLAVSISPL